jgi:hypothetical protein
METVTLSTPITKHTTIRFHSGARAWKALVISARGVQPVPYTYPVNRGGAERAAKTYALVCGLEYREPVQ